MNEGKRRTQGRPNAETQREIEKALLETAVRLFRTLSPRDATMERIASEAGVTKAALYRRFPNRGALLSVALEPMVRQRLEDLVAISGKEADPLAALRAMFAYLFNDVVVGEGLNFRRLIFVTAPQENDLLDNLSRWHARFAEPVMARLEQAMSEHKIARAPAGSISDLLFDCLIDGPANKASFHEGQENGKTSIVDKDFDLRWKIVIKGMAAK